MTTLEIVAGFWFAGVILAMWQIWKPSYTVISKIDPTNILVVRPILSTIVVFVLFTLFLPFMVLPLLIPNKLEEFALGFIKGSTRIK